MADTEFRMKRIKYNNKELRLRKLARNWPVLVWLCAVAVCAVLLLDGSRFDGMVGVVEPVSEPIAPLEPARLKSIHVVPSQKVKAGDKIAQMDTSVLDAEIAIEEAGLMEADESIAGFQQNMLQLVRQFDAAVQAAEAVVDEGKRTYQSQKAELVELKKELNRRESLLAKQLISETDVNLLRPQVAALEQAVLTYPALEQSNMAHLESVIAERKNLQHAMRLKDSEDVMAAIAVKMEARRKILESSMMHRQTQRDSYTLRATRDGVVSRVFNRPGDIIQTGQEIVRLVSETSGQICGFLPEVYLSDLVVGQKTRIYRMSGFKEQYTATVVSIAPEIQALPSRVSIVRGQTMRGRRVILEVEGENNMLPGETVRISAVPSWSKLSKMFSRN